jgi:FAD-dependent oxidoreductase domain-containing protein 1
VQSSWAGLYEYNTVDQNALIGWHPELPNVVLVNGFSGHGLQQSPAAGRVRAALTPARVAPPRATATPDLTSRLVVRQAAAELIDHGRFVTLDLSIFAYERIVRGKPVFEEGIV